LRCRRSNGGERCKSARDLDPFRLNLDKVIKDTASTLEPSLLLPVRILLRFCTLRAKTHTCWEAWIFADDLFDYEACTSIADVRPKSAMQSS
jgi:hypothetical protein